METPAGSATREEGLSLLKAGQVSDAIGVLGKVVSTDPGDAQAHMYLGIACHQGGDAPRAAHHLEESIRLQESPKAYYNLGQVYESSNRLNDALVQYRRALVLDANYTNAQEGVKRLEARTKPPTAQQPATAGPRLDQTQAVPGPTPSQQTQAMPPPGPMGPAYAPPAYGGPTGPPAFLARQIEEQRKIQEARRVLIRSGIAYGAICGAALFLLLNLLFTYVISIFSVKAAFVYLLIQVICGAIYGMLIGLWIGYTAGDEMAGVQAGAVLAFLYGFASALISNAGIGAAVGSGLIYGVLGIVGGYIIGRLVDSSIGQV